VKPTLIGGLPKEHRLMHDEMFLPITCLWEFDSFEEAIENCEPDRVWTHRGSVQRDETEIKKFFDRIEAGVV